MKYFRDERECLEFIANQFLVNIKSFYRKEVISEIREVIWLVRSAYVMKMELADKKVPVLKSGKSPDSFDVF